MAEINTSEISFYKRNTDKIIRKPRSPTPPPNQQPYSEKDVHDNQILDLFIEKNSEMDASEEMVNRLLIIVRKSPRIRVI